MIIALGGEIRAYLRSSPRCTVETDAGIIPPDCDCNYFVADIAVSWAPHNQGQIATPEPILVVGVLSPGTEAEDRRVKVPAYRTIPSPREIALIAQDRPAVTVERRGAGATWIVDQVTGLDGVLRLDSLDFTVPLAELYRGLDIAGAGPG